MLPSESLTFVKQAYKVFSSGSYTGDPILQPKYKLSLTTSQVKFQIEQLQAKNTGILHRFLFYLSTSALTIVASGSLMILLQLGLKFSRHELD